MKMIHKRKISKLSARLLDNMAFFASEMRYMGAARIIFGFSDENGKDVTHVTIWDDKKGRGAIIQFKNGKSLYLPYGRRYLKPYRMTLAKWKTLKNGK